MGKPPKPKQRKNLNTWNVTWKKVLVIRVKISVRVHPSSRGGWPDHQLGYVETWCSFIASDLGPNSEFSHANTACEALAAS
ncbi:hypothetical protein CapIbe_001327 [Capra ibex]